jgi:uncharacterized membrane protein
MRHLYTLLFCALASLAQADQIAPPLPALYAVTDVASSDSLNIRAAPDAKARIIGTLPSNARKIEVVARSLAGQWAQINTGERTGWVSLHYLRPDPAPRTALGLPAGLSCFGTEPFWTVTFSDAPKLTFSTPEGSAEYAITSLSPQAGAINLAAGGLRLVWNDNDTPVTAHILPGLCSDGMSDRAYALHYVDDRGARRGCCSLN